MYEYNEWIKITRLKISCFVTLSPVGGSAECHLINTLLLILKHIDYEM